MKTNIYLAFCFILFLSSCSDSIDDTNLNGGKSHTNYYDFDERIVFGAPQFFVADNEDSSSMIITQPLLLGNKESVVGLANGKIAHCSFYKPINTVLSPNKSVAAGTIGFKDDLFFIPATHGKIYCYKEIENNFQKPYWQFNLKGKNEDRISISDILTLEDGIIVAGSNGMVAKVSFEGKAIWQKKYNYRPTKILSADGEGNIAISFNSLSFEKADSLVFLSKDGSQIFSLGFDKLKLSQYTMIDDDFIYVAAYSASEIGSIYKIDKKGNIIWQTDLPVNPRKISLDTDGSIFITGYNLGIAEPLSGVYKISSKGKRLWQLYFKTTISSPVILAEKNACVCGMNGKGSAAYILDKYNGKVVHTISLNELPRFNIEPSIDEKNALIFNMFGRFGFIRISDETLKRFLFF